MLKYIVILIFLVGCSEVISSGNIEEKIFIPTHMETRSQIKDEETVYVSVQIPDRWFVTIIKKYKNGKTVDNTFEVSRKKFDSLKKGDWFSKDQIND